MDRSTIDKLGIVIGCLITVLPMTWWFRSCIILIVVGFACDLLWHIPRAKDLPNVLKIIFCLCFFYLVLVVSWNPIREEYRKEQGALIGQSPYIKYLSQLNHHQLSEATYEVIRMILKIMQAHNDALQNSFEAEKAEQAALSPKDSGWFDPKSLAIRQKYKDNQTSITLSSVNEYNSKIKIKAKLIREELFRRVPPEETISPERTMNAAQYDSPSGFHGLVIINEDLLGLLEKMGNK